MYNNVLGLTCMLYAVPYMFYHRTLLKLVDSRFHHLQSMLYVLHIVYQFKNLLLLLCKVQQQQTTQNAGKQHVHGKCHGLSLKSKILGDSKYILLIEAVSPQFVLPQLKVVLPQQICLVKTKSCFVPTQTHFTPTQTNFIPTQTHFAPTQTH